MAATCLLYGGLEIDFFNSFSTFRRSIDTTFIPITTKYGQKLLGKILFPRKTMEQLRRTIVSLSTNSGIWTEISSMQNRAKPISINQICKLNGNFPWNVASIAMVFLEIHPGFLWFCNICDEISLIFWRNLEVSNFLLRTVERQLPFHGFGSLISACEQIHTIF